MMIRGWCPYTMSLGRLFLGSYTVYSDGTHKLQKNTLAGPGEMKQKRDGKGAKRRPMGGKKYITACVEPDGGIAL